MIKKEGLMKKVFPSLALSIALAFLTVPALSAQEPKEVNLARLSIATVYTANPSCFKEKFYGVLKAFDDDSNSMYDSWHPCRADRTRTMSLSPSVSINFSTPVNLNKLIIYPKTSKKNSNGVLTKVNVFILADGQRRYSLAGVFNINSGENTFLLPSSSKGVVELFLVFHRYISIRSIKALGVAPAGVNTAPVVPFYKVDERQHLIAFPPLPCESIPQSAPSITNVVRRTASTDNLDENFEDTYFTNTSEKYLSFRAPFDLSWRTYFEESWIRNFNINKQTAKIRKYLLESKECSMYGCRSYFDVDIPENTCIPQWHYYYFSKNGVSKLSTIKLRAAVTFDLRDSKSGTALSLWSNGQFIAKIPEVAPTGEPGIVLFSPDIIPLSSLSDIKKLENFTISHTGKHTNIRYAKGDKVFTASIDKYQAEFKGGYSFVIPTIDTEYIFVRIPDGVCDASYLFELKKGENLNELGATGICDL